MNTFKCEVCKGKGYLWDWLGLSMLTVIAPLAFFLAKNEPPTENGPKEICYHCKGKGFITR